MSLIACGSIHQGRQWFSDDSRGRQEILCVWLLYLYMSNFADSRMEVPTGGPSSQLNCVFFTLCERSAKRDMGHILYYLTIESSGNPPNAITCRNRVRSACGPGKHEKIQHSNRVSRFYSQNISRIDFSSKTVAFPYESYKFKPSIRCITSICCKTRVTFRVVQLLGNIIYALCHVSLNVRIKQKKTQYSITPRIVSLRSLLRCQDTNIHVYSLGCLWQPTVRFWVDFVLTAEAIFISKHSAIARFCDSGKDCNFQA